MISLFQPTHRVAQVIYGSRNEKTRTERPNTTTKDIDFTNLSAALIFPQIFEVISDQQKAEPLSTENVVEQTESTTTENRDSLSKPNRSSLLVEVS